MKTYKPTPEKPRAICIHCGLWYNMKEIKADKEGYPVCSECWEPENDEPDKG